MDQSPSRHLGKQPSWMQGAKERWRRAATPVRGALKALAVVLVVALLEATAFNYQHWATIGLAEQSLPLPASALAKEEPVEVPLEGPVEMRTLTLEPSQPCTLRLTLTDEGNSRPYSFEREVYPGVPKSQTFEVHAYGKVTSLSIELLSSEAGDELRAFRNIFDNVRTGDVTLRHIGANEPVPFVFSVPRVVALLGAIGLVWAFSARRRIFAIPALSLVGKRAAVGSTAVLCAAFLLMSSVHCMWYGEWDVETNGAITYSYPRGYESQYADLAEAFAAGQLHLLEEPPAELESVENPYDKASLSGKYRWDTAYFGGHYYVYFGVLPALLLYLPFYALTGMEFPTFVGCLACMLAAMAGLSVLLRQIVRRFFPDASLGAFLLCQLSAVLGSMLVWVAVLPNLYMMPVSMGLACLAWGAVCYLALPSKPWLLAPGSLLLAAVFACRPQIGVFCLLLVPFGIGELRRRASAGAKAACLAQALLPFVVVFAALGLYNFARFGSPFDFGAQYNLTTNDMTRRPLSVEGGVLAVFYQLLYLPVIVPNFPLLGPALVDPDYAGKLIVERMYGGLLWLSPLAWFAVSLLGAGSRGKPAVALRALGAVTLAAVCVVAAFDGLAAGILPRYQADFALPLMVVGAVGFLYWMERCGSGGRRVLVRLGLACVLMSLVACVALCYRPDFYHPYGLHYLYYAFAL